MIAFSRGNTFQDFSSVCFATFLGHSDVSLFTEQCFNSRSAGCRGSINGATGLERSSADTSSPVRSEGQSPFSCRSRKRPIGIGKDSSYDLILIGFIFKVNNLIFSKLRHFCVNIFQRQQNILYPKAVGFCEDNFLKLLVGSQTIIKGISLICGRWG